MYFNYFAPLEDKSKLVKKQTTLFYSSLNPCERFVFSDVWTYSHLSSSLYCIPFKKRILNATHIFETFIMLY